MEAKVARHNHRVFEHTAPLLDEVEPQAVSAIASIGADVTLAIGEDGTVVDIAYRDSALDAYHLDDWVGQPFRDIVTPECYEKIDALFEENARTGTTRRRQVNHAAQGLPDLPVEYTLATIDGFPVRFAFGEDMRKLSDIQRQLVRTQSELEAEYRKIREAESRYRTIFHKSAQAIVVVDGDDQSIIDVNMTGANLLHQTPAKIVGRPVQQLVERDERPALLAALAAARHGGTRRDVTVRLTGNAEPVACIVEPYRENGRSNLMLTLLRAREADAEIVADDAGVLDGFPEALAIIDRKGAITAVNDQFLDLVHVLNKSLVIDRNLNNWLGASSVDLQVLLSRVREEGQVRQFSTVIRDELGTTKTVAVSAARQPTSDDGNRIGVLIAEAARRDSQFAVPSPGAQDGSSDFAELVGRVPLKDLIREAVDVIEKMCIEAALRQTDNNRASAADMLGLSRQSLYIKLRRHGLEDFGSDGA